MSTNIFVVFVYRNVNSFCRLTAGTTFLSLPQDVLPAQDGLLLHSRTDQLDKTTSQPAATATSFTPGCVNGFLFKAKFFFTICCSTVPAVPPHTHFRAITFYIPCLSRCFHGFPTCGFCKSSLMTWTPPHHRMSFRTKKDLRLSRTTPVWVTARGCNVEGGADVLPCRRRSHRNFTSSTPLS